MSSPDAEIIRGEFFTDGKTFVVSLADTPISGTGASADEAFGNLLTARSAAGQLPARIQALANEQRGEKVRATVVRSIMAGLIALGVLTGVTITAAGMAPRLAQGMSKSIMEGLTVWFDGITPQQQERLQKLIHRIRTLVAADDHRVSQAQRATAADGRADAR